MACFLCQVGLGYWLLGLCCVTSRRQGSCGNSVREARSDGYCWQILLLKSGFRVLLTWLILGLVSPTVFSVSCFVKRLITSGIAHCCGLLFFRVFLLNYPCECRYVMVKSGAFSRRETVWVGFDISLCEPVVPNSNVYKNQLRNLKLEMQLSMHNCKS